MTDSEKLIKLAEWFDLKNPGEGDEVQQDLRRIADLINQYEREAIIYGMPEVVKQLSAKEQENEELKKALDGGMYSEQKKAIAELENEITLLRAENDLRGRQLQFYRDQTSKIREMVFNSKDIGEPNQNLFEAVTDHISELRKRCEDLEAALRESMNYWFFGYKSDYPEEREAFTKKCRNLLNQIKS